MDPWTIALEEVNKIKNLRKLQTWPKHMLGTSHGTYIISFTYGIHTNSDNNSKKHVRRKEKGKFHSFNKTPVQQIPMFQKIIMVKRKQQQQQHQNKSEMGTSLDGLHLRLGLVSTLKELRRSYLEEHPTGTPPASELEGAASLMARG